MNICEHDVLVLQARHCVMYDERKSWSLTQRPLTSKLCFFYHSGEGELAWAKNEQRPKHQPSLQLPLDHILLINRQYLGHGRNFENRDSHIAHVQSVRVACVEQAFLKERSYSMGNHAVTFHFSEP